MNKPILQPKPYKSYLKGMARVVDLFGYTRPNRFRKHYITSDSQALENDWKSVGIDIYTAAKQYERIQKKKSQ